MLQVPKFSPAMGIFSQRAVPAPLNKSKVAVLVHYLAYDLLTQVGQLINNFLRCKYVIHQVKQLFKK